MSVKLPLATPSPADARSTADAPLSLEALLPIGQLQSLLDTFNAFFPAVTAILDVNGKILQASGWQDVCMQFHRKQPESCLNCTESDTFLARNVRPGEFVAYRCKNGLWDVVTPLHIAGQHVGNLYTGQFLFDDETVDEARFAAQAARYGFDPDAYLAALRRVPRLSRLRLNVVMDFLVKLTSLLSQLGFAHHQVAQELAEHERLHQALAVEQERRQRMEAAAQQAQKLESLGLLAGGIAHDFNNLLASITGDLEVARTELAPDSETAASVSRALTATARAADLTRQLLAYSGRGRFVVESVDLGPLLAASAQPLRSSAPAGVEIVVEIDAQAPAIVADRAQLQQVVTNLLANAAEAVGAGPGRIALRCGVVDATADSLAGNRLPSRPPPGRYVFVEVEDTGCGMDEPTLSRVFDPFYTTKFTGRGLGMPAVHGIVTHHGGALFIDTAVGRGTTVRALFPAAQAQGAPSKAAGPARAPAASARRAILVVDDEPLVASALKRMLKRLGFEAHVGLGGAEGLALCGQHAPSLAGAIVDLTMPDMSGTTVAAELQVLCPGLPVILSSGFDVDPVEAAPASSGIVGFLPKPYSLEALARVLERCVHVPV